MTRRRHPKLRATVRWAATALACGFIGVSAVSWLVRFGIRWDVFGEDGRSRDTVFFANGRIWIASQPEWIVDWAHDRLGFWGVGVWSSRASKSLPMTEPYFFGVNPYMGTNAYGGLFSVQYATGVQRGVYFSGLIAGGLLGLCALPAWVGVSKRRLRVRRGCCLGCGYSLEGLTGGVCPECGERIDGEVHA